MELLYLWIDNYKNISKTGFNFSTEYDFEYSDDKRELTITKRENTKVNLFDESFLNITAIIGKNGSGKSNLIEFLRKIFTLGILFGVSDYLLILKNENGKLIVFDEKEKRELHNGGEIEFSVENKISVLAQKVSLIFYTNSFSIYETIFLYNQHTDLSLFKLLNDRSKNVNSEIIDGTENYCLAKPGQKLDENSRTYFTDIISPISRLYIEELRKKIEFVVTYKNQIKIFDFIPASIKINHNLYNQLEALKEQKELTDKIIKLLDNYVFIDNLFEKFENLILIVLFVDIVNSNVLPLLTNVDELYNRLNQIVDEEKIPQAIKDELLNLKGEYTFYEIKKAQSLLMELTSKLKVLKLQTNLGSNQDYTFELNSDLNKFLFELFDISPTIANALYFDWIGLSAGESALLSLFARINSVKNEISTENIWLTIDEGELYLHPEWQRKFLNDLHTYLPKMFPDKKIQLILTSHSPFLVSDLPKENIILLNKDEESGRCKLDNEKLELTFGANIHTLFKESFFLENGTMGEFAKLQIIDLINFLKYNPKKEESENNIKPSKTWLPGNAKKLISIIGEPLIKNQLQDMWDENFIDEEEMKKSIKELAREVYDLKFELDLKIKENEADKIK